MLQANAALTALFVKEFEWCRVRSGESVAIVTEPDSSEHYLVASMAALNALGARTFQLMVPVRPEANLPVVARGTGGSTVLESFPAVVELLEKTDFVVDLTVEGLIHSAETEAILKAGARMLFIKEPADALARLLPTEERTRRIDRSVELLRSAKTMTVSSKAGTNFSIELAGALVTGSRGFCAERGRWANWGQGLVAAYPVSTDVEGDVVLAPGDIVYPFKKYVDGRVMLRFRHGFVTSVEGEGIDAELIRDYMERWGERNAYGISHVGWGLHERALWHALSLYEKQEMIGIDGRAFEGNFLLSTGPNHAAGRHTLCHFDIPMRKCSVFLDGAPIVIEGTIVEPTIRRSA